MLKRVIKQQAISAYDPRVVEVTGITMMVTAQGADHTAGNVPTMDCTGKSTSELVEASREAQIMMASNDSLGLCIFGRSITTPNAGFIVNAINDICSKVPAVQDACQQIISQLVGAVLQLIVQTPPRPLC